MFNNPGRKIKTFAVVVFILGVVVSVLFALMILSVFALKNTSYQDMLNIQYRGTPAVQAQADTVAKANTLAIIVAILIITVGSTVSYIIALRIYGQGQLIENSDNLVQNMDALLERFKNAPEDEPHDDSNDPFDDINMPSEQFRKRQAAPLAWNDVRKGTRQQPFVSRSEENQRRSNVYARSHAGTAVHTDGAQKAPRPNQRSDREQPGQDPTEQP